MIQATGWNSLERTEPDWRRLFASVDPRFHFLGTRTPKGSAVSLIEAVFKSEVSENDIQPNGTSFINRLNDA